MHQPNKHFLQYIIYILYVYIVLNTDTLYNLQNLLSPVIDLCIIKVKLYIMYVLTHLYVL